MPDGFAAYVLARRRDEEQVDGEKLQASLAKRMPADADDAAKKAREEEEEQAHYAESVAGSAASTQMAISGCFGAPIFNILVVLSVALLTEALHLPHGGERAAAAFCRLVLPTRACVDKLVLCFRCHLLPTLSLIHI